MAYLEITLNSLVDGKAMLSTSTSTNFKNRIILPNYFPSILNFTLHFPRTHLSGTNESDEPYSPYPLRCLACRDLQRASVQDDARARSQQLNWIIISSPISQLGIGWVFFEFSLLITVPERIEIWTSGWHHRFRASNMSRNNF